MSALRSWFPDRRDRAGYLQVTGHPSQRVVTVSHWRDRICLASTAIDVEDLPELVSVLAGTLAEMATTGPQPDTRPLAAIALDRLRARWRRPKADIIRLFRPTGGRTPETPGRPSPL